MCSTKHTYKTVQTTTVGLSFTAQQSRNDVREVLCFGGVEKKKRGPSLAQRRPALHEFNNDIKS